nr:MAG TPA: hypothetical protein [Caudoviricetes sp.]
MIYFNSSYKGGGSDARRKPILAKKKKSLNCGNS